MTKQPVGYYDIETYQWDTFVVGAYLPPEADEPILVWNDADEFLAQMAAVGRLEWRAHYGGRFDALLLVARAARAGWRVSADMRGASILRAHLAPPGQRTRMVLTDTHALAPVSLSALARAAGREQKGHYDHERTVPDMDPSSALGRELAEYLRRDVLSLRDGDAAWRRVLTDIAGVPPSLTLGGTAWRSASRFLAECGEDVRHAVTEHDYAEGRAGYFGGRVEVYRTAAKKIYRYDRNSSYPAALTRQPVPVGRRRWTDTWGGEEGTVTAIVRVPECRHPPLPARTDSGRVVYPTGLFVGTWTAVELRAAVERGMARIERVVEARVADSTSDALAGWCWHVWGERTRRPKWQKLIKLFANSLTGKLAQRPERRTLRCVPVDEVPRGTEPLTAPRHGSVWIAVDSQKILPCARPEWAAYLTAEARVELHAQLCAAAESSVYCDTDSVYATAELERAIGSGLGEWKYEGQGARWKAIAPKLYMYRTEEGEVVRGKGMPGLDAGGFGALEKGEAWRIDTGVQTLRSALAAEGEATFARRALSRRAHRDDVWVGGRVRDGADTRAPTWREAREKWR